jgi:hypothetical protein
MTILLQWLLENVWVFYAACAIGVIVYAVRALAAQRERDLSLFTLERETATARVVQAWIMAFVFVAIAAAILIGTAFVLPRLSADTPEDSLSTPTPSFGVETPLPSATPTLSPTLDSLAMTAILSATDTPTPLPPSAEPTETPTPAPTEAPASALSGAVNVRFGDFAELVSFSLPATEFRSAQPVQLTLSWRGLGGVSPVNYTVFTHLLAEDGHLIAQHDGFPADGARPTTSWTAGEVIIDPHLMVFQDTAYTGPARILVGLYSPTDGRVPTQTGADHIALPTTITIIP